nr:sugar O-acetyltransferase [uncultured Methanobrevibacter sp.]
MKQTDIYNRIPAEDTEAQQKQLKKMLGRIGDKVEIMRPFQCDNCKNITIGNNFTGNYNLVILDCNKVTIGDNVMIGPNTLITSVGHPISPKGRREHLGVTDPVTIGNDVWIGGNVTILPGVTIGDNVVIGAGAVVTKDIPDNSLAVGVPARVIKEIENDLEE